MAQRKGWRHTAIRIALVLLVLDAVAYGVVQRSVAGLLAREQQEFAATRLQLRRQKTALLQVQRRVDALPGEQEQLRRFVEKHIPRGREGYSRAALLIEGLTQRSGVQLTGIGYKRGVDEESGPFKLLTLNVYVQGPFANLLNFGHGLDTASDFIVVRGFKFESGGQGMLGLRLTADLYLMP
jgi:hypothetical protein